MTVFLQVAKRAEKEVAWLESKWAEKMEYLMD